MKMTEFIYLYGLNIMNDDYLDSVHLNEDAFKFTKTPEDTIIEMLVPIAIAKKLFEDDDFHDGYERFRYICEYIV
jgi:hypothetical protein